MPNLKKEEKEIVLNRQALIQMYQAGYLDGAGYRVMTATRLKESMKKFERRFFKKQEDGIEVANIKKKKPRKRGPKKYHEKEN